MVTAKQFSISTEQLNAICPFYYILDQYNNFIATGKSFKKLFATIKIQDSFNAHFYIKKSLHSVLVGSQLQHVNITQSLQNNISLKCMSLQLDDNHSLFVCSPVAQDSATLFSYGLNVNDLPQHDSLLEYLMLLETLKKSLSETEVLSSELSENNKRLKFNEKILERALSISKMGSWSLTLGDSHAVFSEGCCRIYGLDLSDNKHSTQEWLKMIHPEDRPWVAELVQKGFENFSPVSFQARLLNRDGAIVHVKQNTIFNFDEDGNPVSQYGLVMDITSEIKASEDLKNSEMRLHELLGNVQEAILIIDDQQIVSYASPAVQKVFGYDIAEITGQSLQVIYHADDEQMAKDLFREIHDCGEGKSLKRVLRVKHASGDWKWVEITLKGQYDNIAINGMVVTLHNINDLINAQKELEELNKNLEYNVRSKTKLLEAKNQDLEGFVYSVSHDLRSPIRVINSYANILVKHAEQMDNAQECVNMLGVIKDYTSRMGDIITDLLQLSRLGSQELHRSEIDFNNLAQSVFKDLTRNEIKCNVKLIITPTPHVLGDPGLVRQVLTNLINNAIKYSRNASAPEIRIGVIEDKEKGHVFYIADNGAGFPKSFFDKIFKPFQRGHSQEEFEGTGVGLTIVNTIIKKHNGEIWATSKENEGATFYFTLPNN